MVILKSSYKLLISFLLGATYLSFFDWLQVLCGVEHYTNFSNWYYLKTPLEFGILTLILSFVVPWFEQDFEFYKIETSLRKVLLELVFFAILYCLTLIVWVPSYLIVMTFLPLILVKLFFEHRPGDGYYFLALGALGPCMESLFVHLGTFTYAHNDIFGVPYWLPLLWGNGGLLVRRLFNLSSLKEKV